MSIKLSKTTLFCLLTFIFEAAQSQQRALPQYTVNHADPEAKGYYFLTPLPAGARNVRSYAAHHMIMNENGEVILFKEIQLDPKHFTCDFKLHENGLMSYYLLDRFYLVDSSFKTVDTVCIQNGLKRDNHELVILANGNRMILGIEDVVMDLSAYKIFNRNGSAGSRTATVTCGALQVQDQNKRVIFEFITVGDAVFGKAF